MVQKHVFSRKHQPTTPNQRTKEKPTKFSSFAQKQLSKSPSYSFCFYKGNNWIQGNIITKTAQNSNNTNNHQNTTSRYITVKLISKDISSSLQPVKTHTNRKTHRNALLKMWKLRSLLAQKILTVSCPSDCQGIKAMKRCECSWANRIKDG